MSAKEDNITSSDNEPTTGPSSARHLTLVWDTFAVFFLVSTPFTNFLAVRSYGFIHGEVLIAFGFFLLLALLIALLIGVRPDALRPIVLSLLVVIVFYDEFSLPQILAAHLSSLMEQVIKFEMLFIPTAIIAWCTRVHLSKILVVACGVMVVVSIIVPPHEEDGIAVVEQEQVPATDRGPIIHLILDQQIGINGLVDQIPGAASMRDELLGHYQRAGFRVFGNAFTHFPATLESLPNLMNNSVEPNAHRWIRVEDGYGRLLQNSWFRHLRAQGYAIEVLQSGYVDFCADPSAPVARCETYNRKDIRILHELDAKTIEKAYYLLLYSFEVDYSKLSRATRLSWHYLRNIVARIGLDLPQWNGQGLSPSTVISLKLMDRVAERLETIKAGEAYVAHLLLPHHPYALEENCEVKSRLADWTGRKDPLWWVPVPSDQAHQDARYQEYFKQVRCLNRRLAGLFEILERRGLAEDATLIVHGDHGSMISRLEPLAAFEAELSPLDIISNYSTLFAIRGPGLAPGHDAEFASVQGLFARHAMGKSDFIDHDDIFLMPRNGVIGPGQRRRPMVRLDPIEVGRRLQTSTRHMAKE